MADWNNRLASYVKNNFPTVSGAARHWKMPRSTLKHYLDGSVTDIGRINPATMAIIYKDTKIEELKPSDYDQILAILEKKEQPPPEPAAPPAKKHPALERYEKYGMEGADLAAELFYAFAEQMGVIGRNKDALREFARQIDSNDAGLVISWLNGLYAPEGTTSKFVYGQPFILRGRRK